MEEHSHRGKRDPEGRGVLAALLALSALLAGCWPGRPAAGPRPRAVTFSPALTRLAFDLGLGDHVVGVTSHCALPPGVDRPRVGNAMSIRAEPILAVDPDLLLVQVGAEAFAPVLRLEPALRLEHFRIETLQEVADAMLRVGLLLGGEEAGRAAAARFQAGLEEVRQATAGRPRRRVLFVVGHEQPLAAGGETFPDEMIRLAGGENVFGAAWRGWVRPGLETILEARPEAILCQGGWRGEGAARDYWQALGREAGLELEVHLLAEPEWTVPGAHLAGYTRRLARLLHPGALPEEP